MKKTKAISGFAALSDANLETKALSIVAAMTGNPNFPTPLPAPAVLSKAVTDFTQALAAAQSRDKVLVAMKNAKKDALLDVLSSLGAYVNFTANGDKTVILSSGFDISKDRVSRLLLTAPQNFKVVSGMNQGEVITSVNGTMGAKTYAHEYTADPLTDASIWQSKYVTTRNYTFDRMESGKKFWFRVAAIGSKEQVAYTDPLSLIIQ